MPFLLTEILNFQGSTHLIGVGSFSYKLFMTAQAVVFSISYFINGNRQNRNNPSDLLHLLYLTENDKFVSNDKIYQTIFNACPEFNLIELNNEKGLSELI